MSEEFKIFGNARYAFRRDTLENWESVNPTLLGGEIGVVTDGTETEKVKIGDGIHKWSELPWWKGPQGDQGPQGIQGPKGDKGDKGEKGDDYNLTETDKQEIAGMVDVPDIDVSSVAPSILNKISGGYKSLLVNDVSPLAHKCSCRLTSDTYEEVLGGSKNLFQSTNNSVRTHADSATPFTTSINTDGSIKFYAQFPNEAPEWDQWYSYGIDLEIEPSSLILGEKYTVSLTNGNEFMLYVQCIDENSEDVPTYIDDKGTFAIDERCKRITAHFYTYAEPSTLIDKTYYPQLELGDKATTWAEYGGVIIEVKPYITDFSTVKLNVNGKSYTPTADGTVTDIASVSPTMEITTNNEHANVCDFTYCVDTKKYIDNSSGGGSALGDIETALDNIIAIQENLIGGGNV